MCMYIQAHKNIDAHNVGAYNFSVCMLIHISLCMRTLARIRVNTHDTHAALMNGVGI